MAACRERRLYPARVSQLGHDTEARGDFGARRVFFFFFFYGEPGGRGVTMVPSCFHYLIISNHKGSCEGVQSGLVIPAVYDVT